MREQVELGRQADLVRGPWTGGSRGLRLVELWTPDVAPGWKGEGAPQDRPAQRKTTLPHLELLSVDEAQPERLSATVVMRQILDAWRSAERQLAAAAAGSPERSQIQAHTATLRMLYQGLFAHVRREQSERTRV